MSDRHQPEAVAWQHDSRSLRQASYSGKREHLSR